MNNGEMLHQAFDRFMPCFFRYINPIIHKTKTHEYPLNENQIKVIMAVNHMGRATPTELSKCFCMPKGSLTTIVRSLIDMGMLKKDSATHDQRKYHVIITQEARAFIHYNQKQNMQSFDSLFKHMSAEDVIIVTQGLNTLCANLENLEE